MGNVRYPIECPGCFSGIILRLGVGHDARQPFFYVCPKCKAATRGAMLWDGGTRTSLEISDGKLLDSEDGCDYTVSINPEIPALATATGLGDPGGSAFITFHEWLGTENIMRFKASSEQLRQSLTSSWGALSRLTTYYVNRDWLHFDPAFGSLVPNEVAADLSPDWKRDHHIHYLYDIFLGPIWILDPAKNYLNMKTAYNVLWTPDRPNFSAVITFAKAEFDTSLFKNTQRDLFDCISRYVNLVSALLPGLMCNLLPNNHQHEVDALRLFRDEYELLRDLYIQSFETVHKALRWVVGAANADAHGDHNRFFPVPGMSKASVKKPPTNLDKYSNLSSAFKRQWLGLLPEWHHRWDELFDRHLRNDIGHASARHDLPTGMILRDGRSQLAYTRFVQQTQRIIHALISTANAMKIVRIYAISPTPKF